MIDVGSETLISFRQLARRLPTKRDQRPVHVSTVHRWRSKGVRGVRIEAIRLGGSWVTSIEAVQRFVKALTAHHDPLRQQASVEIDAGQDDVEASLARRFGL